MGEENMMNFQVIHGSQRYNIEVRSEDDDLTVAHLAQEVASKSGVPLEKQKLIFKGKSLSDLENTLKSMGLKNGSRIMLIGKKFSEEDERLIKILDKIEETVCKANRKVVDMSSELEGVSQGFLGAEKEGESLQKLVRRLGGTAEELAKQLEQLDALSLQDASADVKQKRKRIVDTINKSLDTCDKKMEEGKTLLEKRTSTQ